MLLNRARLKLKICFKKESPIFDKFAKNHIYDFSYFYISPLNHTSCLAVDCSALNLDAGHLLSECTSVHAVSGTRNSRYGRYLVSVKIKNKNP